MEILKQNKVIQVMVIFIALDVVFGILRALKERSLNSTIGIDGIIRKVAMMITIAVCIIFDYIVEIDLIGLVPSNLKELLNVGRIGITDLFASLYCVFEILSIFKNMIKVGLPLPIKLKKFLDKLLKDFTKEVKEKE